MNKLFVVYATLSCNPYVCHAFPTCDMDQMRHGVVTGLRVQAIETDGDEIGAEVEARPKVQFWIWIGIAAILVIALVFIIVTAL